MTSNFDLFDDNLTMPPRSDLFRLEIQGRGTCRQESLLSFLCRLARAHNVLPMDLIQGSMVPLCSIKGARYGFSFCNERIRTGDGYAQYAREMERALSTLTKSEGIADGTFLHWAPLLDAHGGGLLHPFRRWCPSCMADATDAGDVVAYDLLWSSYVVEHCAVHLTPLTSECPNCAARQPFVSPSSSYGRCHVCHKVLGRRGGLWDSEPISARARFNLDAISAMISLGNAAVDLARIDRFIRSVRGLADAYFDGHLTRFEKSIGLSKTCPKWIGGLARPRLVTLVDFCYRIRVLPTDLLSSGFEPRMHGGQFQSLPPRKVRAAGGLTQAKRDELLRFVSELEASERVLTIGEAIAETGVTRSYFKYYLPSAYARLCGLLTDRRVARTRAKAAAADDLARDVARRIFSEFSRVTAKRLEVALRDVGLSKLNPAVRAAALQELQRLREAGVARA